MRVTIKRQDGPDTTPYYQTFLYEGETRTTVAAILENINYKDDLFDENGTPSRRIRWECSCMQKMCGACAMVMNKKPILACNEFVDPASTDLIVLEPLSKFPVISDLCVDRSIIATRLTEAQIYVGVKDKPNSKEFEQQYTVSKCLKCGLCLEICPNYIGDGNFSGAAFANEAYLSHSLSKDRKKEIAKSYKKHFSKGCSKSLACRDICPMKLETLSSIGYMNRK